MEDPTRVFRAVRFAVRFDFSLSRETRALIQGVAKMDLLRRLSKHRLTDELRLVLSEREPAKAIALMDELGVLACLHPDLALTPQLRTLLKATEVIAGVLLLARRAVPFALTLLAPVVVNIVAFHAFLDPAGSALGLVSLALGLYLAWTERAVFAPLFARRTSETAPNVRVAPGGHATAT